MKSSQIQLTNGPLQSRAQRMFLKDSLASLKLADREKFETFGQGPLVPLPFDNIHFAFEDMASRQPEAIAAIHRNDSITYMELNHTAQKLAHHLLQLGVSRGDHVALFLQRSLPMLVGIIGTLKTGAAYVPQDIRITPEAQLLHVLNETKAKVILTVSQWARLVPKTDDQKIICLDLFLNHLPSVDENQTGICRQARETSGDDLCFILFTSGTTGMPNGVQVTHRNLCNILLTEPGSLGMRPGIKVSQILNIAFDMAAWEILGALSHGATLVIRDQSIQEAAEQAHVIIATPSILGSIDCDACKNVETVAVAGEPCPVDLAEKWGRVAKFYNSCGPTEVTIVNTMHFFVPKSGRLSIGKPTANNTVYVLNEKLEPCQIGEIGEMWAGGDCVSKGYLNNPSLNQERYLPDPFLGGTRLMFRTRDLGRWTANGELEHFGRTDDQVKIRGFRVELDSVSRAIESVPGCEQAVTLKLDSRNLVSFVRPFSVDIKEALQVIKERLPYYCLPSLIITMDELPLTSRGKIDKRSLTIRAVQEQERRAQAQAEEVTL